MPSRSAAALSNDLARRVLDAFQARIAPARHMFVLGLSGPQGSGKSTLARSLADVARRRGLPAQTLSLDDVYLGRRARRRLAREVHPLLRTRGVPGTHDLALLERVLDGLTVATPAHPVALPRFDKGHDTRRPPSRWPRVTNPPRLLVLEGWFVGLLPQAPAALVEPVNALERNEDPDGAWRRYVNTCLQAMQPLWTRLDALVALAAPDWPQTCRWREQAEHDLRRRHAPQAMNAQQLARFMQHFERLSRHAADTLPACADLCVRLDAARRVEWFGLRERQGAPPRG
jgi:D-glycerate 3-kinase